MKPVSILIPCYNAAPWLAETLESALAQTWPSTEIIVVDDGSTDASLEVARAFESRGVTVVAQESQGASAARNRALKIASGDYIQYLDADDLLSPEKIERQVRLLQRSPSGYLAICDTIHFFDGEDTEIPSTGWPLVDTDDPMNWLIDLWGPDGQGGMVHPGAWLTPRAVTEEAGLWDERLSLDDDGEYFARVVLASNGIRRAEEVFSHYRKFRSGRSLSGGDSREHHISALQAVISKAREVLPRVKGEQKVRAKRALARLYEQRAFRTYPDYPRVSSAAEKRAKELGGGPFKPMQRTWKARLTYRFLGWKAARRIQKWYHSVLALSPS